MKLKPVRTLSRRSFLKGTAVSLGIAALPLPVESTESQEPSAQGVRTSEPSCLPGPVELANLRLNRPL